MSKINFPKDSGVTLDNVSPLLNRYAILIGINDYLQKPLKFSVNDVRLMKSALISNCRFSRDKIFVIESGDDVTEKDVYGKFKQILLEIKSTIPKDSLIFFFFSGHGSFDGRSVLLFHDKAIPVQEVYDEIDVLAPKHQFYVLDACYSGGALELKSDDMIDYYNQRFETRSSGISFFCSSSYNEVSVGLPNLQSGIYTYNFVKGMNLHSLYDQELGTLSLNEVHNYAVKRILLDYGQNQTPFQYSKVSGYIPFCYVQDRRMLTSTKLEFSIGKEINLLSILDDPNFHLVSSVKKDLTNFLTELISNLYAHNRAVKVELKIQENSIEIHDFSRISFNPFEAQPTQDGHGIKVYQLFFDKYRELFTPSYKEGNPNIITLSFDSKIFIQVPNNPCHVEIDDVPFLNKYELNVYEFNKACKEIVVDISSATLNMSFIARHLFDYLSRHTYDHQLIILKMDPEDMQRDALRSWISEAEDFKRIMIV